MKNFTNSFSSFCEHRGNDLLFGIKNVYGQVVIPAKHPSKIEAVQALDKWRKEHESINFDK